MRPAPHDRVWPFVVCLLAFVLRVAGLNARPVWYDEAFAVLFAEKGFTAMLAGTLTPVQGAAADVHPIVYYTSLNGWMSLVGQSPLAVRMLSAFAGVTTVAAAYGIGRLLFDRRAATVGMLVAAVSPFLVHYSQEARMYAPLALFCGLTILFFWRAVRGMDLGKRGNFGNWVGVAVCTAAAMYMQNLAAVFLLAFGLSTLARPKVFAKVALAGSAAFVLWLPWFLNLRSQLAKLQQAYWVTQPTPLTLLQTAIVYHTGEEMLEAGVFLPLALFAAIILPLMLVHQLFKLQQEADGRRGGWLTALAFGTPVLLFVFSFYQPIYIQRALLPAGLMYATGLGWLLSPPVNTERMIPLPIRVVLSGLVVAVAATGLWVHYTFAQFPRPNFPAAIAYLRENIRPGDLILHSNKLTFFPMYYYDRTLPQSFLADPPGSGSDTLALPTQEVLGLYATPDVAAVGEANRVWLVIFERAIREYEPESHPHLVWLEENYREVRTQKIDDLVIYKFE